MRLRGLVAATLLAAAVTGSCSSPPAPGRVRIGYGSEVAVPLDPVLAPDYMADSILSNFFESLTSLDPDMGLRPGLARGWITPDEHSWLIELQREVRFHDGRVMTAEDVKLGLDRAREAPHSTARRMLAGVTRIEVVDDLHVRLVTGAPDPLLMQRLAHVPIGRETRGRGGEPRFVGTGPYEPGAWGPGASEATAFAGYHGARPAFQRVVFVAEPDPVRMIERLRDGEVDVARWTGPLGGLPPGVRIVTRHSPGCAYLWLDGRPRAGSTNPFADRRVRQAVSQALDRAVLARKVAGGAVPAHQIVPEGIFGHVAGVADLAFDPEAARRLLREAGFPEGIDTSLDYSVFASIGTALAEEIRDQLAAVGIRTVLKKRDWQALVSDWRGARLGFFLAGWIFEEKDAYGFLTDCIETRDLERGTGLFNPGISSARLDALIQKHARTFAPKERLRGYQALMREAREEMPIVPVVIPEIAYAVSERLRWTPRLDGRLLAAEMALP